MRSYRREESVILAHILPVALGQKMAHDLNRRDFDRRIAILKHHPHASNDGRCGEGKARVLKDDWEREGGAP